MSVFNRIASRDINAAKPSIPVWPLMTDFTRLIDGEITLQQMTAKYEFDAAEVAEVTGYLQAIGAMVQSETAERIRIGMQQSFAVGDARTRVNALLFQLMLRIEQGTITENQFKQKLGMT